jgi:hypothetical protein
MRVGHIIEFTYQGHKKWVVVSINDCRACIVPLANRNPENPAEVFDESDSGATGISPNSDCPILGRVVGQIKTRVPIVYGRAISPVQTPTKPLSKSLQKHLIKSSALPPIPDDPEPIDPIKAVINATSRSLF